MKWWEIHTQFVNKIYATRNAKCLNKSTVWSNMNFLRQIKDNNNNNDNDNDNKNAGWDNLPFFRLQALVQSSCNVR